jgi:hypothetical protein
VKQRRHKAAYLTRRLVAAHNVLESPCTTLEQRRAARCRINRTIDVLRRLAPIPAMKRRLDVDENLPLPPSVRKPRRVSTKALSSAAAAMTLAALGAPLERRSEPG